MLGGADYFAFFVRKFRDQDFARVESGTLGTWIYGTSLIFLWETCVEPYESAYISHKNIIHTRKDQDAKMGVYFVL